MVSVPKVDAAIDEEVTLGSSLSPGAAGTTKNWHYKALLVSEGHRKSRRRGSKILKTAVWTGGGPFYTWQKSNLSSTHKMAYYWSGAPRGTFTMCGVVGGIAGFPVFTPTMPSFASHKADLAAGYATGYARARPGNPVADMGQFLMEMRSLPQIPFGGAFLRKTRKGLGVTYVPLRDVPKQLYERLLSFKSLGSEYLNIQFGWRPFVRDLRKMYELYRSIDKRLASLIRNNGSDRGVNRRSVISDETTESRTEKQYAYPFAQVLGAPSFVGTGATWYTVTTRTHTKKWFSGNFRYYVPELAASQWNLKARAALYGALPTPSLVYELLPWSWLIDWFSNVGDVVTNLSPNAVGYPTLAYSYVMKHVTVETIAQAAVYHPPRSDALNSWDSFDGTFVSYIKEEQKVRNGGGNPFGLNVQLTSLSAYQLSILAALGLSRSRVK